MRIRPVITLVTALVAGAVTAEAQVPQARQYAAKFVCGKAGGTEEAAFIAAPGAYFTAINVHNPALTAALEFQKKFTVGLPAEKPGKVSQFFPASLKPDETMQIECRDIYSHLGVPVGTFLEGFVVLQIKVLDRELDVVGVYTAAGGAGVSTLYMERVAGRITH